MAWHDWVAIGLILLLAWRTVHRARRQAGQGCAGSCEGCAGCSSPDGKQDKPEA